MFKTVQSCDNTTSIGYLKKTQTQTPHSINKTINKTINETSRIEIEKKLKKKQKLRLDKQQTITSFMKLKSQIIKTQTKTK